MMVAVGLEDEREWEGRGGVNPDQTSTSSGSGEAVEGADANARGETIRSQSSLLFGGFLRANPTFEDEPSNNASSASSAPGLFEDGGLASEFMVAVGLEDEDEWDEAPAKGKDRYAAVMASYDAEGGSSVSTLAAPSGRALAAPSGRELGI